MGCDINANNISNTLKEKDFEKIAKTEDNKKKIEMVNAIASEVFKSLPLEEQTAENAEKIKKGIKLIWNLRRKTRSVPLSFNIFDTNLKSQGVINSNPLPVETAQDRLSSPLGLDTSGVLFSKYYGTFAELKTQAIRYFKQSLVDSLTFKNDRLVISEKDVLENLSELQNSLLIDITIYINNNNSRFGFKESDNIIFNLDDLSKLKSKLDNITVESLLENNRESKKFREVYNKIVLLTNFDTIISLMFGNDIIIDNFGKLGVDNKYRFNSKNAEANKTWRVEGEAIDTAAEIPNKIKNFIETRALVTNSREFLTFNRFLRAIADIRNILRNQYTNPISISLDITLSPSTRALLDLYDGNFLRLIEESVNRPLLYFPAIFEILSNSLVLEKHSNLFEIGGGEKISNNNLVNIETIYHHIFDLNNNRSLRYLKAATFKDISELPSVDNISNIYEEIVQVIHALYPNNLDQIISSYDGSLKTRRINSKAADNTKWTLLNSLEARFYNPSIESLTKENDEGMFTIVDLPLYLFKLFSREKVDDGYKTGMRIYYNNTLIGEYYRIGLSKSFNFEHVESNFELFSSLINNILNLLDLTNINSSFALEVILNMGVGNNLEEIYKNSLIKLCLEALYRAKISFKGYKSFRTYLGSKLSESLKYSSTGHIQILSTVTIEDFLYKIATAKANITGQNSSIINRDSENKAQFGVSFSRVLGTYDTILARVRNEKYGHQKFLLFRDGVFLGVSLLKEVSIGGNTKQVFNMDINELFETYFVHTFLRGLAENPNSLIGNGIVAFLPCTNSDKSNVDALHIDLKLKIKLLTEAGIIEKSYFELTQAEIEELIKNDNKNFYGNILGQTGLDLLKVIINPLSYSSFEGINLNTFEEFLNLSEDSALQKTIDLVKDNPNITYDKVLYELSHIYDGSYEEALKPLHQIANYINEYLKSDNFSFLANHTPKMLINTLYKNYYKNVEHFNLIKEVHYSADKGGDIHTNLTLLNLYDRAFDSQKEKDFWLRSDEEALRDLVDSHFYYSFTDSLFDKLQTISQDELWLADLNESFSGGFLKHLVYAQIIPNDAKAKSTKIRSNRDLESFMVKNDIKDISDFFLRARSGEFTWKFTPLMQKWLRLDYLFTQEWNNSTLGSDIAHGKYNSDADIEESLRWSARNKRNVSNTASMYPVLYDIRQGVPFEINTAIMETPKHKLFNVDGKIHNMETQDGANYVNPVFSRMFNASLQSMAVGETIKPYIFAYLTKYGVGFLDKCAGFPLNNSSLRNSPDFDAVLFKKSINIPFGENFDISKTYWGTTIDYSDIYFIYQDDTNEDFKQGNYYKVNGIQSLGNNQYLISYIEVDNLGNVNGNGNVVVEVEINSLYDLYKALGAEWSMSKVGDKLIKSEISLDKLFKVVTSVTSDNILLQHGPIDFTTDSYIEVETEEGIEHVDILPLKSKMIHLIADEGAVKHGLGYLNTLEEINDPNEIIVYNTFHADLLGVQLDKEHTANDTLAALMTLVMSACSTMGYSVKETNNLYIALSKFCDSILNDFSYDENLDTKDKIKKQLEVMTLLSNLILKALALTRNSYDVNFATKLALNILAKGDSSDKIPFSDPMIYGKVISTIASKFNRMGIKQKIPGNLGVLNPSYNRVKLYGGKLLGHYTVPKVELLELQQKYDSLPVYDNTVQIIVENNSKINKNNTLSNLRLDRPYKLIIQDQEVYNSLAQEGILFDIPSIQDGRTEYLFTLTDPSEYKKFRKIINETQSPIKICEVCFYEGKMIGRNLASMDYRFNAIIGEEEIEGENIPIGERYNISDLGSILAMFLFEQYLQEAISDEVDYRNEVLELFPSNFIDKKKLKPLIERKAFNDFILKQLKKWRNSDFLLLSKEHNTTKSRNVYVKDINDKFILAKVDIDSVEYIPFESVVPKFNRDIFHLDSEVSILDIISKDTNFFFNLLKSLWDTSYEDYDVCLRNSNGKHIYIRINSENNPEWSGGYDTLINVIKDLDSLYYFTEGNNILMEAYQLTDKLYKNVNNLDIIIDTDLNGLLFYLSTLSYDLADIKSTDLGVWDKFDESRSIKPINGALYDHYNDNREKYHNDILNVVTNMEEKNLYEETNEEDPLYLIKIKLKNIINSKYTSFLLALKFIVARIPAQSKQSFMEMIAADFIDGDINNVYVSDMLLWLQGSDFDIDAATFWLFAIEKDGTITGWSPFFNYGSMLLLKESMKLPLPTGISFNDSHPTLEINETKFTEFDEKYKHLLDTKYLNSKEDLILLKEFLAEMNDLDFTSENENMSKYIKLYNSHNLYLNKIGKKKLQKALDNFELSLTILVAENPLNLSESLTSVDDSTSIFKDLTKDMELKLKATRELPGNPLSKMWAIRTNAVGKMGIAITASSQKVGFLVQHALNLTLMNADSSLLEQIATSGVNIGGITYNYVANLRRDFNDPKYDILLDALENGNTGIITSAIMSLATDNAKELELANLNATDQTLGLYTYGVFLGVPPKTLVKIIGSKAGLAITKLVQGNIHKGTNNSKVLKAVALLLKPSLLDLSRKYNISKRQLNSIKRTLFDAYYKEGLQKAINDGKIVKEKVEVEIEVDGKKKKETITKYSGENITTEQIDGVTRKKITFEAYGKNVTFNINEKVSGTEYLQVPKEFSKTFFEDIDSTAIKARLSGINQLLIAVTAYYLGKVKEDYNNGINFIQALADIVMFREDVKNSNKNLYDSEVYYVDNKHKNVLNDLEQLALGSSEMQRLGRLILNQGMPAVESEIIGKREAFENIIIDSRLDRDITNNVGYKIDMHRFLTDQKYQLDIIKLYDEKAKHTFNIPLIITKLPHVLGYLKVFDAAILSFSLISARFQMTSDITKGLLNSIELRNFNKTLANFILKTPLVQRIAAIGKMVLALLINDFLYQQNIVFNINEGDYYVENHYKKQKVSKTAPIRLGTPNGNSTFKAWMESTVIPNLKKGITTDEGIQTIVGNKFINDLAPLLSTKTVLKLPIAFCGLTEDMNIKTPEQRNMVEEYLKYFGRLSSSVYSIGQDKHFSVLELLFLYALIVNNGAQGKLSLMPLFDEFLSLPIIQSYHKYIENLDYILERELLAGDKEQSNESPVHKARRAKLPKFNINGDVIDTAMLNRIIAYLADIGRDKDFYYIFDNGEYALVLRVDREEESAGEEDMPTKPYNRVFRNEEVSATGAPTINVIKDMEVKINKNKTIKFNLQITPEKYIVTPSELLSDKLVEKMLAKVSDDLKDVIIVTNNGIIINNLFKFIEYGGLDTLGKNTIIQTILEILINC